MSYINLKSREIKMGTERWKNKININTDSPTISTELLVIDSFRITFVIYFWALRTGSTTTAVAPPYAIMLYSIAGLPKEGHSFYFIFYNYNMMFPLKTSTKNLSKIIPKYLILATYFN